MPQQARDAEFAPHAAIDLRDQNSMFLALEELGIACMQAIPSSSSARNMLFWSRRSMAA